MRTLWKPALLLASCALVGCTSEGGEDAGRDSAGSQGSLALLSLERTQDGDSELPRFSAGAKVARFRGIDGDGLLKLLGAEARELDTCGSASAWEERGVSATAEVDLLSVGPIGLRVADAQHSLAPRLFPALATTAAGWFYAGTLELGSSAGEAEEFALSAAGEQGLGRFELTGAAPREVQALTLAGQAIDGVPLTISRTDNVELSWEPESTLDRLELELFAGGSVLSCALRDDGHFVLSRTQLRTLEADENASLVVRRVRQLPVQMSGVESAYARISTTRTRTLTIR